MRIKGFAAALAAAVAVVGGGAIVSAPAASAATVGISVDCHHDVGLQANVGDTVVITMTADCPGYSDKVDEDTGILWNLNGVYRSDTGSGFFGPAIAENADYFYDNYHYAGDWYGWSDGSGTTTITTTLLGQDGAGNPLEVGSFLTQIGYNGFGPYGIYYLGGIDTSSPKSVWVQGYGRASSEATCDEGWAPSWDQWPNGGQGGWVCTRAVYEDGSGPAS